MSVAGIVLTAAALPVGITGAWSPCGFSMVETIGLRGDTGRRRTALAACATFAPGAAIGGVATFGLLGLAGSALHGAGGRGAYVVAACLAVAAAILEARGTRIVPQVRRQLPEGWRWSLPLPVASAFYGILLGLGFTTFVLSFGVWALAAISFALGDPATGAAIGLAFGVGRAIPVLALAPIADRPSGIRVMAMMAERPSLYRRFRMGDALAMGAAAIALFGTTGASAAKVVARPGADPSVSGGALVFQRADGSAALLRGGHTTKLPGRQPSIGGARLALRRPGKVEVRDSKDLKKLGAVSASHVVGTAVSNRWLVITTAGKGHDVIRASRLAPGGAPGQLHAVDRFRHPARAGHPSLDGAWLAYGVSSPARSRIIVRKIGEGGSEVAASSHRSWLTSPSISGRHLLYDETRRERQSPVAIDPLTLSQKLILARRGGGHRKTLLRIGESGGRLWSTALGPHSAYVTVQQGGPDKILRVRR